MRNITTPLSTSLPLSEATVGLNNPLAKNKEESKDDELRILET